MRGMSYSWVAPAPKGVRPRAHQERASRCAGQMVPVSVAAHVVVFVALLILPLTASVEPPTPAPIWRTPEFMQATALPSEPETRPPVTPINRDAAPTHAPESIEPEDDEPSCRQGLQDLRARYDRNPVSYLHAGLLEHRQPGRPGASRRQFRSRKESGAGPSLRSDQGNLKRSSALSRSIRRPRASRRSKGS